MSDQRWRDLGVRVASAAVLAPLGLLAIWAGGAVWLACLAIMVVGLAVEWVRLCGPRHALLAAGAAYIAAACLSLVVLRAGAGGLHRVLFMMLVVWSADIGAYVIGRLVGGPRMAPRISPGKTWSGALGGTLSAVATGAALGADSPSRSMLLALVLSVVAQCGDLLESAVKRQVGAKDSGWIIPGHGGLLDRLDGVLAAAPAALLWAWMSRPEHVPFP